MNIPTVTKEPCRKGSPVNSKLGSPLRDGVSFPPVRKPMSFPLIGYLRKLGDPTAVRRFIASIGVYPIKRIAFRHLSHIGEEVLEGFPTITNFDTPAGVILDPVGVPHKIAPSVHSHPTTVCRSFGKTMRPVYHACYLAVKAATATSVIFTKIVRSYDRLLSAVAPTENLTPWKPFKGSKSTDFLSKFYHGLMISQGEIYVNRGWCI